MNEYDTCNITHCCFVLILQIIPPASELGKNFLQNMNMTELERLAPGFEVGNFLCLFEPERDLC